MAVLTVQTITSAGLAAAYASATAGGDTITDQAAVQTGGVFLHAKNATGSAITLTIGDPTLTSMGNAALNGGTQVSVPATTGDRMVPVPPAAWNPSTQQVAITYSGAGLTIAALRR